jgi:hypothetical protein
MPGLIFYMGSWAESRLSRPIIDKDAAGSRSSSEMAGPLPGVAERQDNWEFEHGVARETW